MFSMSSVVTCAVLVICFNQFSISMDCVVHHAVLVMFQYW